MLILDRTFAHGGTTLPTLTTHNDVLDGKVPCRKSHPKAVFFPVPILLMIASSFLAPQVSVSMVSTEAERICIDRMVKGQEEPFSGPEGLAEVDSKMASLVSTSLPVVNRFYSIYRAGDR